VISIHIPGSRNDVGSTRMKPGTLVYMGVCMLALAYLVIANARGYLPFASNAGHASRGNTAGQFHK